jgi:hypothetical protein
VIVLYVLVEIRALSGAHPQTQSEPKERGQFRRPRKEDKASRVKKL